MKNLLLCNLYLNFAFNVISFISFILVFNANKCMKLISRKVEMNLTWAAHWELIQFTSHCYILIIYPECSTKLSKTRQNTFIILLCISSLLSVIQEVFIYLRETDPAFIILSRYYYFLFPKQISTSSFILYIVRIKNFKWIQTVKWSQYLRT